jgi:hypothetical protein
MLTCFLRQKEDSHRRQILTWLYLGGHKKRAHRETITRNSAVPVGVAFSVDENGTLIPDKRAAEPTESPELSSEDEVRYAHQYDSYGNWTQQTVNHSSSPDKPSYVCHRKITYY